MLAQIPALMRSRWTFAVAALASVFVGASLVIGQTAPAPSVELSPEPLYARGFRTKPTLTLALSVEFPTVGTAYPNPTTPNATDDASYATTTEYLGYFDPNGCYQYNDTDNHFERTGAATSRACDGTKFSGNFMNWATTSAIDILRYGLTGGDRVVDTTSKTVVQRAVLRSSFYNSSNFPSKRLAAALVAGAVPAALKGAHTGDIYVANCLNRIHFGTAKTGNCNSPGNNGNLGTGSIPTTMTTVTSLSGFSTTACAAQNGNCAFAGIRRVAYGANGTYTVGYFNGGTDCSNAVFGDPVPGVVKACYLSTDSYSGGMAGEGYFFSRVQVCDAADAASRPRLCTQYPNGSYKPTGNLQRYSDRLRVAVFGYLKDDTYRNGGVLRAPMKYVGDKYFDNDYKLIQGSNPKREWDPATGIFVANPEGSTEFGISGAINYLNQFGRTGVFGEYKTYDPVGELYYEAVRYIQGLDPTPSAVSSVTTAMKDGFPVYTSWTDPHPAITGLSTTQADAYACVRNNILGIGDVNTHFDRFIPGNTVVNTNDAARTANVQANEPDFKQWTKVIAGFEGNTSVSYVDGKGITRNTFNPGPTIINRSGLETASTGANQAGYLWAGVAYWANTHDIRPSGLSAYAADKARPGMRIKTYMIDVNEYGQQTALATHNRNAFFLAAKYGGFTDVSGTGNPFVGEDGVTTDNSNWQRGTTGEAKNYFLGNKAAEMLQALDDIFASVVREAGSIAGAAISTTRLTTNAAVYQGSFDPSDWSGALTRYTLAVDGGGNVTISAADDTVNTKSADSVLDAMADVSQRKIFVGRSTPTSAGAATEFTWGAIEAAQQLALRLPAGVTNTSLAETDLMGQKRLAYIRGDRTEEGTGVFRKRGSRLGDIVNSGAVFSGAPSRLISDSDYQSFYTANANRTKAVFVGANDGMLHAFHADTMQELFAYIPSMVVPRLNALTSTSYVHQSYVDATPWVGEAKVGSAWKSVLVSGLGGGGQGVFALDVTNPSSFSADNVLWEFSDRDDVQMGNVIGRPQVLKFRTSAPGATSPTYKHLAVVASGVNHYALDGRAASTNNPVIFLLDLSKSPSASWALGTNYWKVELTSADGALANGLVGVSAIADGADAVKALYAGDLQGQVWKLDFSSQGQSNWTLAKLSAVKNAGGTAIPLFQARDNANRRQPITMEPTIAYGPNQGMIVLVGTGKFLEANDNATPFYAQSAYAFYDKTTSRTLDRSFLQTATASSNTVTAADFVWGIPASASDTTARAGWFFDFPDSSSGERQISGMTIFGGKVLWGTVLPAASGCSDGEGRLYVTDLGTGDGSFGDSNVGIQGQPLIVRVGSTTISDVDTTGRGSASNRWQVILQGSGGVRVSSTITDSTPVFRMSWRQIFNYQELKNKP